MVIRDCLLSLCCAHFKATLPGAVKPYGKSALVHMKLRLGREFGGEGHRRLREETQLGHALQGLRILSL